MALNVGKEVASLKRMTVMQLRAKHVEAFGEKTRSDCRCSRWQPRGLSAYEGA